MVRGELKRVRLLWMKAIPTNKRQPKLGADARENAQWRRRYLRMRQKGVTRNNSLLGTHATMRTRRCKKERSYLTGSFSSCILSILSDMQSADFFSNNLDKIKPERTPYWGEKRSCIIFLLIHLLFSSTDLKKLQIHNYIQQL